MEIPATGRSKNVFSFKFLTAAQSIERTYLIITLKILTDVLRIT